MSLKGYVYKSLKVYLLLALTHRSMQGDSESRFVLSFHSIVKSFWEALATPLNSNLLKEVQVYHLQS
jgi:hypothetical protein